MSRNGKTNTKSSFQTRERKERVRGKNDEKTQPWASVIHN